MSVTGQTLDALLDEGSEIVASSDPTAERRQLEGFGGQYQAADNWCWAAVAASVATYYDRKSSPCAPPKTRKQCDIVDMVDVFKRPACSWKWSGENIACLKAIDARWVEPPQREDPPQTVPCFSADTNRQYFLNRALRLLNMLERSIPVGSARMYEIALNKREPERQMIGAGLGFDDIEELLAADRVVCLRTTKKGARHFIIIYGCQSYPGNDLLVWDPASGPEVIEADRLMHEYGPITHKIITRPPSPPPPPPGNTQ
jgi:hypothetical protein